MRFTKIYETRFKPYLADPSCIPLRNTQLLGYTCYMISSQLEYNKLMLHEPLLSANRFAGCKCQLHKTTDQKPFALKVARQVILRDKSYKGVHTATRNTEDVRTSEKDHREQQTK